jgi:uncharacterized membrane protein
MIILTLFYREGCHLCDEVVEFLDSRQQDHPHRLVKVDISQDPQLEKLYGNEIPVIRLGETTFRAPINREELLQALDLETQKQLLEGGKPLRGAVQSQWTAGDCFSLWLSRHYMALVNALVFLFIFFPFLAPLMMKSGWETPALAIYKIYGTTCHQLAYRSIFLFGEQLFYPKVAANIPGVVSFSEATSIGEGNTPEDIWMARNFIGDDKIGYKVAICQRDIAIYLGILAFNFTFIAFRKKIKPLHWLLWILIGILPVAVDGLSQLLSQPPFSFIPYRESTPLWRMLTGFLFGFTTAWFGVPHLSLSMEETREYLEQKYSGTHLPD